MTGNEKTCPSARCTPGASLLGVLGADGRIKHVRTSMRIDEDFVERAHQSGPPEAHMRFAAPCVESHCEQWTGGACGVINQVLVHLETKAPDMASDDIPPCTIRATCRWYSQQGQIACKACDLVVTGQNMAARNGV